MKMSLFSVVNKGKINYAPFVELVLFIYFILAKAVTHFSQLDYYAVFFVCLLNAVMFALLFSAYDALDAEKKLRCV